MTGIYSMPSPVFKTLTNNGPQIFTKNLLDVHDCAPAEEVTMNKTQLVLDLMELPFQCGGMRAETSKYVCTQVTPERERSAQKEVKRSHLLDTTTGQVKTGWAGGPQGGNATGESHTLSHKI